MIDTIEDIAPAAEPVIRTNPNAINVSGATVTQATSHLPEDQMTSVRWLHDHARQMHWTWEELAANVDLDKSTLFRLFHDKYRDGEGHRIGLDGICKKIRKLKQNESRLGKIENPDFLETKVYKEFAWLYKRAYRNHKISFAYGESQIGKSTALKELTRRNNGGQTTYVELPPVGGSYVMLRRIADALHVPARVTSNRFLEEIVKSLDPSKFLIVDEIHRVFANYNPKQIMPCLDSLRYIYDQSGCGMLLCGTNVFRDEIRTGAAQQFLKQFLKRGRSYEIQFPPQPYLSDLQLAWEKHDLDAPPKGSDAEHLVHHIAKEDGLGVFMLRLNDAVDNAKGKPVTWKNFIDAYAITELAAKLPVDAKGIYKPEY